MKPVSDTCPLPLRGRAMATAAVPARTLGPLCRPGGRCWGSGMRPRGPCTRTCSPRGTGWGGCGASGPHGPARRKLREGSGAHRDPPAPASLPQFWERGYARNRTCYFPRLRLTGALEAGIWLQGECAG